jgi:AcrR family transcriptional regulator
VAEHAAGVGADQAGHDADERAFTGAVVADQAHDLAGRDGEVEAVERDDRPVPLPQPLRDEHRSRQDRHNFPGVVSPGKRSTLYRSRVYTVPDKRRQILLAALAVADEEGLDAVSMRSVAERVGVSAMALYPHVGSKEALLDGLVDILLAELPVAEVAGDDPWTRLTSLAHELRALARRHPSAFGLLLSRPSVTPDAVRATDAVYQALLDLGGNGCCPRSCSGSPRRRRTVGSAPAP